MNESFVLFTKIDEVVSELTTEQKGQLFQAILDYQKTGVVPEMEKLLKVVFLPIKHDMDYCAEQREKAQQQKSEAGKKSAEARSAKANTVERRSTPLNDVEQRSAKANTVEHNVMYCNVDVDVMDRDNTPLPPSSEGDGGSAPEKKKSRSTRQTKAERNVNMLNRLLSDPMNQDTGLIQVAPSLLLWMHYKGTQHNFEYEETGMKALLTQVAGHIRDVGAQQVMDVINLSMSNGWKGIIWDKLSKPRGQPAQKPQTRFHNFEQRPYTDEDEALGTSWLQKGAMA